MAEIVGDSKGNRLVGSSLDDVIFALGGNDTIEGMGGKDTLDGGAGDDRIFGGTGGDTIQLSSGADVIDGGTGIDTLSIDVYGDGLIADLSLGTVFYRDFERGAQTSLISNIEDVIGSDYQNDRIMGDAQANTLYGLDFDDFLWGREGDDRLYGGRGNDTFRFEPGSDLIDGGAGFDKLDYSMADQSVRIQQFFDSGRDLVAVAQFGDPNRPTAIDNFLGIEHLVGTRFDDTIYLDGGDKSFKWVLEGKRGNDVLFGGGNDRIFGGGGNDHINGLGGRDLYQGGSGRDRFEIEGVLGSDTLVTVTDFSPGADQLQLDIAFGNGLFVSNRDVFDFLDTNDDSRINGQDRYSTFGDAFIDGSKMAALTISVQQDDPICRSSLAGDTPRGHRQPGRQ